MGNLTERFRGVVEFLQLCFLLDTSYRFGAFLTEFERAIYLYKVIRIYLGV